MKYLNYSLRVIALALLIFVSISPNAGPVESILFQMNIYPFNTEGATNRSISPYIARVDPPNYVSQTVLVRTGDGSYIATTTNVLRSDSQSVFAPTGGPQPTGLPANNYERVFESSTVTPAGNIKDPQVGMAAEFRGALGVGSESKGNSFFNISHRLHQIVQNPGRIESAIRDFQRNQALSQEAARKYEQIQSASANALRVSGQEAQLAQQRAKMALNQGTMTFAFAGSSQIAADNVDAETLESAKKIESIVNDRFAYREYHANPAAQHEIYNVMMEAATKNSWPQVVALAEPLLYGTNVDKNYASLSNNGIIQLNKINPKLPISPLEQVTLKSNLHTPVGQLVRRVANWYQAEWAASNGLARSSTSQRLAYLTGLGLIQASDDAATNPLEQEKAGYLAMAANDILVGINSFGSAFYKRGTERVAELKEYLPNYASNIALFADAAATDPAVLMDASVELWQDLPQIKNNLTKAVLGALDKLQNGDIRERSAMLGTLGWEVFETVVTSWATPRVGSVMRAADTASESAKAVAALSKTVRESTYLQNRLGEKLSDSFKILHEATPAFTANLHKYFRANNNAGIHAFDAYKALKLSKDLELARQAESLTSAAIALQPSKTKDVLFDILVAAGEGKADYLKNLDDLNSLHQLGLNFEKALAHAAASVPMNVVMSRIIEKEVFVNGVFFTNSASNTFVVHGGMASAVARFAVGGSHGQPVLSAGAAIGDKLTSHLKRVASKISFLEKESYMAGALDPNRVLEAFAIGKFDKVLDLTDEKFLVQNLKLSKSDLLALRNESKAYQMTQLLGGLAERSGFDAILAHSAIGKSRQVAEDGFVIHILKNGVSKIEVSK